MRRILVVGMSGAGKTTAATRIAARLGLPFHELDRLAFGPGWSTPPGFVESVGEIAARDAWVFDSWGYEQVRDVMWAEADTIVWLDFPAHVVIPRLVRRSLWRTVTRRRLFGGNRETWGGWLRCGHPVWHALTSLRARRVYLAHRTAAPSSEHLRVIRLRSPRELDRWIEDAAAAAGQEPRSSPS